jgi:hypothetical protein
LIDGLYSLLPDPDPQEVEARRSILRSQWSQVSDQLAIEGGPISPKVEQLLRDIWSVHLVRFGIELGMILVNNDGRPIDRNRKPIEDFDETPFTISRQHVITADEEQNLTDFIALRDYINSVRSSWRFYQGSRNAEFGEDKKDLGTGLVLLARALSVVAEQTAEVYAAMDSVYVGTAERQVTWLTFDDESRTTVEELMSWVQSFATEEAPRLIQDGGLRGVEAIEPIARTLSVRIDEFANETALPNGLLQRRVKSPLRELHKYLDQVVEQADGMIANGNLGPRPRRPRGGSEARNNENRTPTDEPAATKP